ncbi:MAG TPA: FliM/FliN family flagellar motor C-terminal domain-containing protein [Candidatus Eremiobacteraceae bacterium]|nr:FliM/FliN family flagellar motor C-terminal domain-containing protein [Candidatus Eremiobacteraceae bacterium]
MLSSDAQRSLLEFVLDGPGAAAPTAVERTIIGECVDQLLVAASRSAWREIAVPEECDGVWRCDAALSHEGGRMARFYLYTRAAAVLPPPVRPLIGEVPLELMAVLRPLSTTLGLMSGWEPGVILPLHAVDVEPEVRLTINHGPVAFGVLGSAEGRRAVRLNGHAAGRADR